MHMPDAYKGSDDPIANKVEELLKSDTFKKYFDEANIAESPKESK